MKEIHKFKLDNWHILGKTINIEVPFGAELLNIGEQSGELVAWYLVSTNAAKITKKFKIYGTGQELPSNLSFKNYVVTVQMKSGLVWHVFKIREE